MLSHCLALPAYCCVKKTFLLVAICLLVSCYCLVSRHYNTSFPNPWIWDWGFCNPWISGFHWHYGMTPEYGIYPHTVGTIALYAYGIVTRWPIVCRFLTRPTISKSAKDTHRPHVSVVNNMVQKQHLLLWITIIYNDFSSRFRPVFNPDAQPGLEDAQFWDFWVENVAGTPVSRDSGSQDCSPYLYLSVMNVIIHRGCYCVDLASKQRNVCSRSVQQRCVYVKFVYVGIEHLLNA